MPTLRLAPSQAGNEPALRPALPESERSAAPQYAGRGWLYRCETVCGELGDRLGLGPRRRCPLAARSRRMYHLVPIIRARSPGVPAAALQAGSRLTHLADRSPHA